jgi:DNA polymerase-3 subunit epsilon
MILFVDTETTGLVNSQQPAEHESQPYLVQLGAILMTDVGSEVSSAELVIRPEGWNVPEGAARVHGITSGIANMIGVPLLTAMSVYTQLRANAEELVAYNLPFDETILAAAIHRTGRKPSHPGPKKQTCCMAMATPILALPPTARMKAAGFDKYKPPNLTEAYMFFFGEKFSGAHSALADCRAAARIYFEIKRREKENGA